MSEPWIVNASPSIVLGRIGCLGLLDSLNPVVRIPHAVIEEIRAGLANDPCATATLQWAMRHCLDNRPVPGSIAMWGLGAGESQVLSHCLDTRVLPFSTILPLAVAPRPIESP